MAALGWFSLGFIAAHACWTLAGLAIACSRERPQTLGDLAIAFGLALTYGPLMPYAVFGVRRD